MPKRVITNTYQYEDLLVRSKDRYANAKYEVILDWLKHENITSILDVGCGSGDLSFLLAAKNYFVDGIDIDKEYIALANRNVKEKNIRKCTFEVSGIENYKPKKKYDVVIATDVLEHIKNDSYAFEKLTSFTKSNGLVIITVPAGQYLFGFHDEQLGHFRRYSLTTFKKILPKNLKIIHIRFFGFLLIPVPFLFSKILRKNYPVAESGDKQKNPLINKVFDLLFKIEKKASLPLGTSLLFIGRKSI